MSIMLCQIVFQLFRYTAIESTIMSTTADVMRHTIPVHVILAVDTDAKLNHSLATILYSITSTPGHYCKKPTHPITTN